MASIGLNWKREEVGEGGRMRRRKEGWKKEEGGRKKEEDGR